MKLSLITFFTVASALLLPAQDSRILQAERLFAGRDHVERLEQAVFLLEDLLRRDQSNYEGRWRLAKYRFYLSDGQKDKAKRLRLLEAGIEAAKKAVELNNERPEGHFWLAANYGEYANLKGVFKSLWLIKTVRREFEAVLKIDPAYEDGGAYLALGEMNLRLPRLLGGNDRRGIEILENGLKVGPKNAELKLALAKGYAQMGRKEKAKRLLEEVLSLDDPSRTAIEQEDIRRKARHQLDSLR